MVLARVIGTSIAPGSPATASDRLLMTQPVDMKGASVGPEVVAIDRARATPGSLVLLTTDDEHGAVAHYSGSGPVHTIAVAVVIGLDASFMR